MKYKTYSASVESMQEEINTLRRQLAEAEAKLVGAQERTQILFDAKIKWADRAHAAESKLALAEQDARRYRWLKDHGKEIVWREVDGRVNWPSDENNSDMGALLDAAIAAGEGES